MSDEALPEPDRADGAPHPRETHTLFGQGAAEAAFLDAYSTGRLHHGWLLTGPRGVGKATLAWRLARFLLAAPLADESGPGLFGDSPPAPATLDIPADHPVARRMLSGSEPRLFVLRRGPNEKGDRLSADIRVDEVRKLMSFLHLSVADGGRRVIIVDAADEMNPSASNALLKALEEPPALTTFLLVSHQPSGLLPTIRSRCRELRLTPLDPEDLARALTAAGAETEDPAALTILAGGSAGAAIRLVNQDGLATYADLIGMFSTLPRLDRSRAIQIADSVGRGNDGRFDLLVALLDLFLARLAHVGIAGAAGPEAARAEAALLARLCPGVAAARVWAEMQQSLGARARQGKAVNLDPGALLLDMILKIDQTAGQLALR